jgi:hypothetical protein
MEKLPLELLEEVWGYLDMLDLIRCQQVRTCWKACIPGERSTLNDGIFSPGTRWTTRPGKDPYVHIWVEPSQHVALSKDQLSRLSLSLDFDSFCGDWDDKANVLNSILKYPFDYSDLIHPAFTPGPKYEQFQFTSFDDLNVLTQLPSSRGESWEGMMACVPIFEALTVKKEWRIIDNADTCDYKGSDIQTRISRPNGITVWDVVHVLRSAIRNMELELRAHCDELDVVVGAHGQEIT